MWLEGIIQCHALIVCFSFFCLSFFIWFLFIYFIPFTANIELQTIPQVEARCEENVTLICHASFLNQSDVKIVKFSWVGDTGRSCVYEGNNTESCKSKSKASQYELTLILTDIKPIHEGTYFCKIHSSIGMQSKKTKVVVKGASSFSKWFCHLNETSLKYLDLYRLPWKCCHLQERYSCYMFVQGNLPQWYGPLVPGRHQCNRWCQHTGRERPEWLLWLPERNSCKESQRESASYLLTVDTVQWQVCLQRRNIFKKSDSKFSRDDRVDLYCCTDHYDKCLDIIKLEQNQNESVIKARDLFCVTWYFCLFVFTKTSDHCL